MTLDGTMVYDTPEGAADAATALGISGYHKVQTGFAPGQSPEELKACLYRTSTNNSYVREFLESIVRK